MSTDRNWSLVCTHAELAARTVPADLSDFSSSPGDFLCIHAVALCGTGTLTVHRTTSLKCSCPLRFSRVQSWLTHSVHMCVPGSLTAFVCVLLLDVVVLACSLMLVKLTSRQCVQMHGNGASASVLCALLTLWWCSQKECCVAHGNEWHGWHVDWCFASHSTYLVSRVAFACVYLPVTTFMRETIATPIKHVAMLHVQDWPREKQIRL